MAEPTRSSPPAHGSGAAGEARRITAVLIGALQAAGASYGRKTWTCEKLLALLTRRTVDVEELDATLR